MVHRAAGLLFERSVGCGNERAYSNHFGLELLHEQDVFDNVLHGLIGRAHHDACAGLVTEFLELAEAVDSVVAAHVMRVQLAVMLCIVRFVAEQEAVGTSLLEPSVGLLVALSDREGNGMLRKKRFDVCDELHHPFVVLLRVFTSLQYEGFEAELVSFLACLYDLFLCESVALYGCVGATDATVIAVVFAIVGYFNKGSYIYSFSELPNGSLCGLLSEPVLLLRVEL